MQDDRSDQINKVMLNYLECLSSATKWAKLLGDAGQNWIDGRKDGAALPGRQQKLGDARHEAYAWLGPDTRQSGIKGGDGVAVDDLSALHGLPRSDVQAGHIAADIPVPDNREQPGGGHHLTSE